MGILAGANREEHPQIIAMLADALPEDGSKLPLISKLLEIMRSIPQNMAASAVKVLGARGDLSQKQESSLGIRRTQTVLSDATTAALDQSPDPSSHNSWPENGAATNHIVDKIRSKTHGNAHTAPDPLKPSEAYVMANDPMTYAKVNISTDVYSSPFSYSKQQQQQQEQQQQQQQERKQQQQQQQQQQQAQHHPRQHEQYQYQQQQGQHTPMRTDVPNNSQGKWQFDNEEDHGALHYGTQHQGQQQTGSNEWDNGFVGVICSLTIRGQIVTVTITGWEDLSNLGTAPSPQSALFTAEALCEDHITFQYDHLIFSEGVFTTTHATKEQVVQNSRYQQHARRDSPPNSTAAVHDQYQQPNIQARSLWGHDEKGRRPNIFGVHWPPEVGAAQNTSTNARHPGAPRTPPMPPYSPLHGPPQYHVRPPELKNPPYWHQAPHEAAPPQAYNNQANHHFSKERIVALAITDQLATTEENSTSSRYTAAIVCAQLNQEIVAAEQRLVSKPRQSDVQKASNIELDKLKTLCKTIQYPRGSDGHQPVQRAMIIPKLQSAILDHLGECSAIGHQSLLRDNSQLIKLVVPMCLVNTDAIKAWFSLNDVNVNADIVAEVNIQEEAARQGLPQPVLLKNRMPRMNFIAILTVKKTLGPKLWKLVWDDTTPEAVDGLVVAFTMIEVCHSDPADNTVRVIELLHAENKVPDSAAEFVKLVEMMWQRNNKKP